MMLQRWIAVTEPAFPWEREALTYVRERLPDQEPFRAWSNFEFVAENGSINEVDLLVVSLYRVYLVEIKSRPGQVSGDAGTWTWSHDGRLHTEDNPLLLANRKAKKLKSLLQHQQALRHSRAPYIEPLIFLSAPGLRCELSGPARHGVYLRPGVQPESTPDIIAVLQGTAEAAGRGERAPAPQIDRRLSQAVARAMEQAGIRPLQRAHRVGDYTLERLLAETGYPPVLFHKGELAESDASTLSEAVRTALRDRNRRVVGVVLNAVDDHLAKSDQLRLAWTIGQFQHLDALLYEAQLARRAIILTSDHGHVLEEGASRFVHGEEERWRAVNGELVDGEMIVEGPRVEAVTAAPRIVAPWSEIIRYAPKKQGYHGGVTPQEVLVPMRVFARREWPLKGWEVHPEQKPTWWNHSAMAPSEAPVPVSRAAPRRSSSIEAQESLFEEPVVPGEGDSDTAWIDRLLSSTLFEAQRQMAGRRAPDNSIVKAVLRALDQDRGRISRPTLARKLGQPEFRLGDLLVGLQRLLNVDGYQVIAIDETSGTIELNRHLLDQQFQLS